MILKVITAVLGCAAIAIEMDSISSIYAMWGAELANGQQLNLNYLLSEKPEKQSVVDFYLEKSD